MQNFSNLSRKLLLSMCCLLPCLCGSTAFAQQSVTANYSAGQPHPDAPSELKQFEFMLGQFARRERVRNQDGSWGEWEAGEWNARYFMNGHGILDETRNYVTGVFTSNLRVFDADAGKWKVTFLKLPGYSALNAEGGKEGEQMVLINQDADQRWVFSDITTNSYKWTLYVPFEGQYIPVREIESQRREP